MAQNFTCSVMGKFFYNSRNKIMYVSSFGISKRIHLKFCNNLHLVQIIFIVFFQKREDYSLQNIVTFQANYSISFILLDMIIK